MVRTDISRSIIDVNRNPDGVSLYPGQATTELCPTTTFDGEPLYRDGEAPDEAEVRERKARWYAPYHDEARTSAPWRSSDLRLVRRLAVAMRAALRSKVVVGHSSVVACPG